ncbi:class I SAM-dependent methyltransferase [Thermotoga sp. KOL6]|uniref:class I SAM-dependent methyltransferase n=1 Tax=Thermotoga sp. KOL6 TaxID=126741 RepID=UPI000CC6E7F9|nr:class I SAM-dependent methyltransferase [Thermotoga sp. KOL6]PLV59995.1 methyltransferase type 11 [Thermotoga sp. KOL6]
MFDQFVKKYDEWFLKNRLVYLSELRAVKSILPKGRGIEIGVGTGRFAVPLGIKIGVEPSKKMAEVARKRGIFVLKGTAEKLPLKDESFDFAIMVTTICFVDNPRKALEEVHRVVKREGYVIVGIVDRESFLGKEYEANKEKSVFYRNARFFSTENLLDLLRTTGFGNFKIVQTLFKHPTEVLVVEPVKDGYGKGAFVVIRAEKI